MGVRDFFLGDLREQFRFRPVSAGVIRDAGISQRVFARDGYACVRCGNTHDLTVDHIFPRTIGGTDHENNLRTLCRSCNSSRPFRGPALILDLARDNLTIKDLSTFCPDLQETPKLNLLGAFFLLTLGSSMVFVCAIALIWLFGFAWALFTS